ncbi:HTH-type transcriptional repressor Bm3R1 [bacterium BMS3Abin03]|nr:HTH-type transcriptional repressor Bm3R1 [bacterium BMS3Abin03]
MNNLKTEERERIFNCVKSLFLKEGFYKISMDTLAAELKISKKTIYKYFPSKEAIVNEIVKTIQKEMSIRLDEILQSKKNAVIKLIHINKLIGSLLFELNDTWINDLRIHLPKLWQGIDEFRTQRLFGGINIIVKQGQKQQLIKNLPPEMIVIVFVSALRGVINNEFLLNSNFSYKDAIQTTLQILFSGILTPKGLKVFQKSFKKV